jgi:3-deoxy-D-manno-octulosonic-acid transferase
LPRETEVLVGDTMGELQLFYAAADLAFVGASLVMRGGHNILEPGAVGVPVIFGPHMFNFEDVAALALDAGAGLQVYDSIELSEAADSFIRNPQLRVAAGRAAQRMIADNQGSLEITLDLIERAVTDRSQAGILRDVSVSTSPQIH